MTWYTEQISPGLLLGVGLHRILHSGRTQFQQVALLETGPYGRTLVLDGKTQSAEADEFVYHEALVQPAMMAHPGPKRVLVAGGGEGATAREVLRHPTVREVVMVDLDAEVVALCQEHLPRHHAGAFRDPRLRLLHIDAFEYLEQDREPFDVIVMDLPDPLEGGPSYLLYTAEFYRLVASRLDRAGLMVTQAGPAGPLNHGEVFTAIRRTVATVLPRCAAYRVYVPSFGSSWGFVVASSAHGPEVAGQRPADIDRRIGARVGGGLRFYDGIGHQGIFSLPKYLRAALEEDQRVITRQEPLYAV